MKKTIFYLFLLDIFASTLSASNPEGVSSNGLPTSILSYPANQDLQTNQQRELPGVQSSHFQDPCQGLGEKEEEPWELFYPWLNKRWHHARGAIHEFISGHAKTPIRDRYLPQSPDNGLDHVGAWVPYDSSIELILNKLSELYSAAPDDEGLKIADLGCGIGFLSVLIGFIADGKKPITVYLVDGVKQNLVEFTKLLEDLRKAFLDPFKGVDYRLKPHLIEKLSETKSFGEEVFGTFDAIIYSSVLHLMSFDDKRNAIGHAHHLLKCDGFVFFSHTELIPELNENDPKIGMCITTHFYNPTTKQITHQHMEPIKCPADDPRRTMSPQLHIVMIEEVYRPLTFLELSAYSHERSPSVGRQVTTLFNRVTEAVSRSSLLEMCLRVGFKEDSVTIQPFYVGESSRIGGARSRVPAYLVIAQKKLKGSGTEP